MNTNHNYTDITFELFNSCNGSCPGCMISSTERKTFSLDTPLLLIKNSLKKISNYGQQSGIKYRPVFSFGDVPKLDEQIQREIYLTCIENDMAFGLTMTLVDENFDYETVINNILKNDSDIIFDITIDPFRLDNKKFNKYKENLKMAIKKAKGLHLQILISNSILENYTPEELYSSVKDILNGHPVFLSFSPTIENITKTQYNYSFINAYEYAKSFYSLNIIQYTLLKNEIERFKSEGDYNTFSQQTFHIDYNLNIYPVCYTIFGDIIQDKRNMLSPLGNISLDSLNSILNNTKIKSLSIKNAIYLENSPYNCEKCEFYKSCIFNGVGLVRNIYKNHEKKIGHCHGPIGLLKS